MNKETQVLMMLRGIVASLPEADRVQVEKAAEELRRIVERYGDHGRTAIGLLGAEFTAED